MREADTESVLRMMYDLWPEFEGEYDFTNHKVFVCEDEGSMKGFISFSIRPWVDGADISPVPHIEGWYVAQELRGRGVGTELLMSVENWCRENGYTELTSDTLLENKESIKAHESLGFTAMEQIQYFKKKL